MWLTWVYDVKMNVNKRRKFRRGEVGLCACTLKINRALKCVDPWVPESIPNAIEDAALSVASV